MARQQLPPQITKLTVADRRTGKPVVRYQVTADSGTNALTGRRQQVRRRFATEREARLALAEICDSAAKGNFVARTNITVNELCDQYIAGRHKLRASSLAKLKYDLAPLRERYGTWPVQRLGRNHLDALVAELIAGGSKTAKGRVRRPWSADSVNKVITSVNQLLADAKAQGIVARNAAELVSRVSKPHKTVDTYTEAEVVGLLTSISGDRLSHAWELALSGLRRGEVCGLRWLDVDLDARTLSVRNNRVDAGGAAVENDPKSAASRRTLPLPDRLVTVLRAAKTRQSRERLALGAGSGPWDYVVCNEVGQPYHPQVLSRYWAKVVKRAGVRHIKLHAARHTCATLMHLSGVRAAVIAEWIGHEDATLTIRLYAHSQNEALRDAGSVLNRVVGDL